MSPTKPKSTGACSFLHDHRRAFVGADEAGVDAADTDGGDLDVAARREDASVDEPVQDHRRHFERVFIGDAAAVDHLGIDAELASELSRLGTAAMDEHDPDPELVQQRHLLDESAGRRFARKDGAARFDDERLALEHADVRRRLLEGGDDDRSFARAFHEASLRIEYSTAI